MQSYILTNSRFRKRESSIAIAGFALGVALISASVAPHDGMALTEFEDDQQQPASNILTQACFMKIMKFRFWVYGPYLDLYNDRSVNESINQSINQSINLSVK